MVMSDNIFAPSIMKHVDALVFYVRVSMHAMCSTCNRHHYNDETSKLHCYEKMCDPHYRKQSTWPTVCGTTNWMISFPMIVIWINDCMCCMWLSIALICMDVIDNILSLCCELSTSIVVLLPIMGPIDKHNILPSSMQHLHMSPKVYAIHAGRNGSAPHILLEL